MRCNGRRVRAISLIFAFALSGAAASRAAQPVIFVDNERSIGVFDAASGTLLRRMPLGRVLVDAIATGPDGSLYLAIEGGDSGANAIVRYDRTLTQRRFTYAFSPAAEVLSLTVDGAGDVAAFGNFYPREEIYVYKRGVATVDHIVTLSQGFSAAAYAPDGALWYNQPFFRDQTFNEFRYIPVGSSAEIATQLLGAPKVSGPAFTFGPDGALLVMGPGAVISFEGRTGKAIRSVPIYGTFEPYADMKLSADGRTLYVLAGDYIDAFAYPAGGMPLAIFHVGRGAGDFALGLL